MRFCFGAASAANSTAEIQIPGVSEMIPDFCSFVIPRAGQSHQEHGRWSRVVLFFF